MTAVELTLPKGHVNPALQLAVHPAVVRPTETPYLPAGQDVHDEAPLREYCPRGQADAVELTLPAGHMYLWTHGMRSTT